MLRQTLEKPSTGTKSAQAKEHLIKCNLCPHQCGVNRLEKLGFWQAPVLVEYLSKLTLAKAWGSGDVASADGIRFVVPPKTIYAGPNPRYFGIGRGITSYDLISDQFSGLNKLVITGTIRDSLYLLELVLCQHYNDQTS